MRIIIYFKINSEEFYMQKLTTIREIFRNRDNYLGQTVEIGGWVRNIRDSKTFGFLVVNDGTYFEPLQVVFHDAMANFSDICRISSGTAATFKSASYVIGSALPVWLTVSRPESVSETK